MKIKVRKTLLCACGSGKKYKKCCGSDAVPENPRVVSAGSTISKKFQQAAHYHQAGEFGKAEALYQEILEDEEGRGIADVYINLGHISEKKGRLAEAKVFYQKALELSPDNPNVYNNLGIVFLREENPEEAKRFYEKALSLKPDLAEAWNNLGMVFKFQGLLKEAKESIQKAIMIKPDYADACNNLGNIYIVQGDKNEAISWLNKAIAINPRHAGAYNNIGNILRYDEKLEEAESCYLKAISMDSDFSDAYSNLGNIYELQGKIEEAIANYRKASNLRPDLVIPGSNLLLALNYSSNVTPLEVFSENLLFEKKFGEPLRSAIKPHSNDLSPDRRLRIGYVSPDFRNHSVAFFLEPVLANHASRQFEIFCYSNNMIWDQMTRQIHSYTDQWRNIVGLPDKVVAELIRRDQIDILVDLAGHTSGNRILLFARKPAPVQVTWLGYPNTTGISAMDYRFTDRYSDPVGMTEAYHTEQLIRLPETFSCYRSPDDAPEIGILPAIRNGFVTFGSFNIFCKVTPQVLRVWAELLKAVPGSHLLLKTGGLNERRLRERVFNAFSSFGILPERLELLGRDASRREHLEKYNRVDIGLDTFPYNGTTTLCEALWMGVPVITLEGKTHAGRVGVSQMTHLRLPELIAKDEMEYVEIAKRLAGDLKGLERLRQGMRSRMIASPLMNENGFTRNLEEAYRDIWGRYVSRGESIPMPLGQAREPGKNQKDKIQFAQNLLHAGRLDEAVAVYQEVLMDDSLNSSALHDLGIIAFQKGNPMLAADFLSKAISARPDYAVAFNNLGVVCNAMGRQEEAKACYEMALTLKPDYAEAHHNRGIIFRGQGAAREAIASFQKALELKPDYIEAAENLKIIQEAV